MKKKRYDAQELHKHQKRAIHQAVYKALEQKKERKFYFTVSIGNSTQIQCLCCRLYNANKKITKKFCYKMHMKILKCLCVNKYSNMKVLGISVNAVILTCNVSCFMEHLPQSLSYIV